MLLVKGSLVASFKQFDYLILCTSVQFIFLSVSWAKRYSKHAGSVCSHEGQLWFPGLWTAPLAWVWRSDAHRGWVKLEVTPGSQQHWDSSVIIWSKICVRSAEKKKKGMENLSVNGYTRALK